METTAKNQFMFGKLFVLGVIAVGMILGTVFWLTDRINQVERAKTADLVELLLMERMEQTAASVADYAYWDLAYEVVTQDQPDAIYEHLGSGATESTLFDQLFVLSPDLTVTHAFDGSEEPVEAEALDVASLTPFVKALRENQPSDYELAYGIGKIDGAYAAIAMAWITPDDNAALTADDLPILLGTQLFSDEQLAAIERLTQGSEYAVRDDALGDEQTYVLLPGPNGETVARIVWTPTDTGSTLRADTLPAILLVCAGLFGICLSAANYFRTQSSMLEQAYRLASTDQLTGLLNRSGLNDVLHRAETVQQLEKGHAGVVYLDLDDFKKLNDQRGHEDGDRALKVTAQRLKACARQGDHVVRMGGDEFVVLVLGPEARSGVDQVAQRVAEVCGEPIEFAGHDMVLRPSIGMAVSELGVDWQTLLHQADSAMYFAKHSKADAPIRFGPGISRSVNYDADAAEAEMHRTVLA